MGGGTKRWLPLESNPEVMNTFVAKLGVDTSLWAFCDVLGLDPVRTTASPLANPPDHHRRQG